MKIFLALIILYSNAIYCQVRPHAFPKKAGTVGRPTHNPPEVVNSYTEVISYDQCANIITVSNSSRYNVGDTVLLIQMKGALIDTSNTASFGTIINYRNAGNYEFNYISRKSGNQLTFRNKLTRAYDIPTGVVQLVRVPYYDTAYFIDGLGCMAWDGSKGGVLAVLVSHGLTSQGPIDVGGKGFKGGEGYNNLVSTSACFNNNYNYPYTSQAAAYKGESITGISQNISKGKGSPAGGGGGGLSYNSGGGGGGNMGKGGSGGYQSDTCGNAPFDNRGLGGKNLLYPFAANKIFMGSGGGAGQADNTDGYPTTPNGGAGGGIAIIITDTLLMLGKDIIATGSSGQYCYSADCRDGRGGGGAGGTILLSAVKILDTLTIQTGGGDGGFVNAPIASGGKVGPGGGGGGGAFYFTGSSLPANVAVVNTGGIAGFLNTPGNTWGATNGTAGLNFFNGVLPFDTSLFKKNIDSVRIRDSITACNNYHFSGLAFTNTDHIASWAWNFGDGNIGSGQNTSHVYSSESSFPVSLLATDINGCKDSVSTVVSPIVIFADAGADTTVCSSGAVAVALNGTGTGAYAWSPAAYLDDSTRLHPIATIDTTTLFYLFITRNNCTVSDSVKISVNALPVLLVSKSNDINCTLPYTKLKVTGATGYVWTPASSLNNSSSDRPIANPSSTTTYTVSGTNDHICFSEASITVLADQTGDILLPNTFTPNGDGLNDCFGLRYYRDVQNLLFIIYNRYGEKVFETRNADECWDGHYRGQAAEPGTYIYYLSAKNLCGDIVKKGSIHLIR